MEDFMNSSLQEMSETLKQIGEMRSSCGLKDDSETKRLHAELLKRLESVDDAIRDAMLGIS
jgi:hypothetical protein